MAGYTFKPLSSGNFDVLENGKSIYGAGTQGVSAQYAKSLGYAAPAPIAPAAPAYTPPPAAPTYAGGIPMGGGNLPIQPQQTAPQPVSGSLNPNANWYGNFQSTGLPTTATPTYAPPTPTYTPPPQSQAPAYTPPEAQNSAPQTPYTPPPANTPPPTQAPPVASPATSGGSSSTDNQLLQSLLDSMKPSATETGLQGNLNNLEASRRLSYQNIEGQPIATSFITGQEAAVNKRVGDEASTLQAELATQQAQRLASVDATKFALTYNQNKAKGNAPIEVSPGASLYSQEGSLLGTAPGGAGAKSNLTEVSPGASLYDPTLGKSVYTAPTPEKPAAAANTKIIGSASSGYYTVDSAGKVTPLNVGGGKSSLGATSGPSLDVGSSGESVKSLQQFLVDYGYMKASDMATGPGTYGPKTQAAVAAFQKAAGVDTSGGGVGTFGPRTQAAAQAQGFKGIAGGAASRPDPKSNYTATSIPSSVQSDLLSDINKPNVTIQQLYSAYPDVSTTYINSLYNSLKKKSSSGSSLEDQINSLFQ